jgi:hypothetical protein
MLKRALSIAVVILCGTGSAMAAQTLFDRTQSGRMTVLRLDLNGSRFMCAEHRRWTTVARADLAGVHPGDIVRVTRQDPHPAHIVVVRTAADELSSPEK